jgi:threonine synthase
MINPKVLCTACGNDYPESGTNFRCPICGGLFDYAGLFRFYPEEVDGSQPGIWRYRQAFGLPSHLEPVSLGEGNTPLVWAQVHNRRIAFKCEYTNPSGSFKDRGSTIIAAWLKWHGVTDAVEDSSGNAGASFAAYAARAGIKARIYVPGYATGPKRRQIEAYGAEIVSINGSRSDVSAAVMKVAETGTAYASHAFLPFNLPGYATIAYEIVEQLGQLPGAVIVPAGQGGLLLGMARGFSAFRGKEKLYARPRMIGVQVRACAPLWSMYMADMEAPEVIGEHYTLAEGVKVRNPLRKDAVLSAINNSGGTISIVEENEILIGRNALARLGFYVEPTSAIVWSALVRLLEILPDPVVVILTGSGLKYE